ncbi:MAG: response regulator transcription factor [Acidobacteriota bacterium]|nr:response regulator transcription factor [Acidobacteriota bacterium]
MPIKVLVVEDNPQLGQLIRRGTQPLGIECTVVGSGAQAIQQVPRLSPDLMILDLTLPDMDGLEVLSRLRRSPRLHELPVIVLTSRAEEAERIVGLELGADDYLTKPVSPRELTARVRAVLRRTRRATVLPLRAGSLSVDESRRRVFLGDTPLTLTPREFELLVALMKADGRVLRRQQLLEDVWRFPAGDAETRTVDVHVRALRKKLGVEAHRLITHKGVGYAFRFED